MNVVAPHPVRVPDLPYRIGIRASVSSHAKPLLRKFKNRIYRTEKHQHPCARQNLLKSTSTMKLFSLAEPLEALAMSEVSFFRAPPDLLYHRLIRLYLFRKHDLMCKVESQLWYHGLPLENLKKLTVLSVAVDSIFNRFQNKKKILFCKYLLSSALSTDQDIVFVLLDAPSPYVLASAESDLLRIFESTYSLSMSYSRIGKTRILTFALFSE